MVGYFADVQEAKNMSFLVKPKIMSYFADCYFFNDGTDCGADYEPCSCFGGDTCVTYV